MLFAIVCILTFYCAQLLLERGQFDLIGTMYLLVLLQLILFGLQEIFFCGDLFVGDDWR